MEKFYKKRLSASSDTGVYFSELVELLEGHELKEQILEQIDYESYKDQFITVPGAKALVNAQKIINKRFKKEDLIHKINETSIYKDEVFTINFPNLASSPYLSNIMKNGALQTEPIYSSQRDFFAELYGMDKYAGNLIKNGQRNIVEYNVNAIQTIVDKKKKFRILHDLSDDTFYLRAITSSGNYFNYDNNITIVVALFALHNEMLENNISYSLSKCEYNESFIRIFFRSNAIKELKDIGHINYLVEISNDEIKREALKFSGICSIMFGKNDEKEIFIQPKEIKSKVFSIKHNQTPENAIKELTNFGKIEEVHDNITKDILKIVTIKNPDQIKHLVKTKVENALNQDIKAYKFDILNELRNHIDTVVKLLDTFHKIELLAGEDINAIEYIRYIFYQSLIERR
ncbi:hypothetical protein [Sphingobacterium siyangense]|jgi:hypothetical protein|uniref:hypothetical protein n=1 Tax=Sphingobacterium siyangense TaxID=459529 RepID=UPI0028A85D7A|nr:hypothetical protein [Sphingobacterium siyangense]